MLKQDSLLILHICIIFGKIEQKLANGRSINIRFFAGNHKKCFNLRIIYVERERERQFNLKGCWTRRFFRFKPAKRECVCVCVCVCVLVRERVGDGFIGVEKRAIKTELTINIDEEGGMEAVACLCFFVRRRHRCRCHPHLGTISPTLWCKSTNAPTQGVNFTNILRAPFLYESLLSSFSVDKLRFDFFGKRILAQKLLVKRWWNWPKVFDVKSAI